MNHYQLQPVQELTHFTLGGQIDWPFLPSPAHFKNGGKVFKQKQKQRQTQIVHIHNAPKPRRRRTARKQASRTVAPPMLPPQFTSVPSGYLHRPEPQPQAIHPLILSRLDGIEQRMAQSLANQMPISLSGTSSAPAEPAIEAPMSNVGASSTTDDGNASHSDKMESQIPVEMPSESEDENEQEQPGKVVPTPSVAEGGEFIEHTNDGHPLYKTGYNFVYTYKKGSKQYKKDWPIYLNHNGVPYFNPIDDQWKISTGVLSKNQQAKLRDDIEKLNLGYPSSSEPSQPAVSKPKSVKGKKAKSAEDE